MDKYAVVIYSDLDTKRPDKFLTFPTEEDASSYYYKKLKEYTDFQNKVNDLLEFIDKNYKEIKTKKFENQIGGTGLSLTKQDIIHHKIYNLSNIPVNPNNIVIKKIDDE